jgi:hypothetical protein
MSFCDVSQLVVVNAQELVEFFSGQDVSSSGE